jgi:hypothetical protein
MDGWKVERITKKKGIPVGGNKHFQKQGFVLRGIKVIVLSILFFLSSAFLQSGLSAENIQAKDSETILLKTILENCAEYCQRLSEVALFFVCEEKIRETIYNRSQRTVVLKSGRTYTMSAPEMTAQAQDEKNKYVYDYQLVRNGKNIKESRILLQENGHKKSEKNAPLKTKRFNYKHVIYGPIGLLSSDAQQKFDYRLVKERRYRGSKVVIIKATPKKGKDVDYLYGTIWINKDDFSIVKIEWDQASLKNLKAMENIADQMDAKPLVSFSSEYKFEKNGIRFPSRFSIQEAYIHKRYRRRLLKSETTVIYDKYKFFMVDTEIKY